MTGGKLLYNPVMNRWINSYDESVTNSVVFKEGYDDPTYLGFKVEFGDWGASILDQQTLNLGVTTFRANKSDYDALPIGLLNCPIKDNPDQSYWQNGANENAAIFNNADIYSAFAYLRSRNEDTRAEYLYYFVNGLMEIQKNTPYIFKKISGINGLETFDPKTGRRINNPKITLECYEGLNLKIRTLMEFYRKAAWDDIYQRWILPENMREFKMIIYIFERRIFQDAATYNVNGKGETVLSYSDLNADIPVKAFECCPCEFDIKEFWKGDYDNAYVSGGEETTSISITVKNVKTFFKNGLLNPKLDQIYKKQGNAVGLEEKIDTLMVYDLVESVERQQSLYNDNEYFLGNVNNTTINSVRAMFLNKNILLENEEAAANLHEYIFGKSLDGASARTIMSGTTITQAENPDGSITQTTSQWTKRWPDSIQRIIDAGYNLASEQFLFAENIGTLEKRYPRAQWITALVNPPSYDSNKSFWRNIGANIMNVIAGSRRQILISAGDNIIAENTWTNLMNYLFPQRDLPISTAVDINGFPMLHLLPERQLDKFNFSELEQERKLDGMQYSEMEPERDVEDWTYSQLEGTRQINGMQYSEMEPEREIKDLQYSEMELERKLEKQQYSEMEPERKPNDSQYSEIEKERKINPQQYSEMEEERELKDQQYSETEPERIPDNSLNKVIMMARTIPGMEDITLEQVRKLPEDTLISLKNLAGRALPKYEMDRLDLLDIISKAMTEINSEEFKKLEDNAIKDESNSIKNLLNNSALFNLSNENTGDKEKQKLQNIKEFAKIFAENHNEIRSALADNIIDMKNKLKNLSEDVVRALPEIDMVELRPDEKENNNIVMLSIEDKEQLDKNIQLIGLDNTKIKDMSFNSLVQLNNQLEERIIATQPLIGLTDIAAKHSTKQQMIALKPELNEKPRRKLGKDSNIDDTIKQKSNTIIY